ncbi:MAG: YkgJ family cysteine cluster protein [Dehalococcoidia bacterium]|nr:YkgJ family cysteine cluster protein [Dehalococcoidia bacterium]MCL2150060.1 YkgJ family cysteine cluster protein [Dehalococcoidia bacterium]
MGLDENILWLQDFHRRFEIDVKELHRRESIWAACQKCPDGWCCGRNSYISLKRRSNPFIVDDWYLMLEHVRTRFTPAEKKQLAKNVISQRSACIFLFQNRCRVYASRPWGSRMHPYAINFAENIFAFPVGKIALPTCPSLATAFGLKTDEKLVQMPQVIDRAEALVLVKLHKHKPIWLLDASCYVQEYTERGVGRKITGVELEQLLILARLAGGEYGELLRLYLEVALGLRADARLVPLGEPTG